MYNLILDAGYFWNDNCTHEEATEAAKRWSVHDKLVQTIQAFIEHTEFVGNTHLAVYVEAKQLLNNLKPI